MRIRKNQTPKTSGGSTYHRNRKQWVTLLKHVNKCQDFYKLFALSVLVDARIHQVKPDFIDIREF